MNHLLEIRAICKALLLWLSGANVVHCVKRKIRKKTDIQNLADFIK